MAREAYHDKQKGDGMSHPGGDATIMLGNVEPEKNIFFESDPGPSDIMGRAFAVTGECNLGKLAATVEYLRRTSLFQRVTQIGVIVRIAHMPNVNWSTPLQFEAGQEPRSLAAVREKLGEQGDDVAALHYVIAILCEGVGWNPADVRIEESPIG